MASYKPVLIALVLCFGLGRAEVGADNGWRTDERNREALLNHLRPALRSAGGAGRLYYTTACHARNGYPIPFPSIKAQSATKGETGLAAVRSVFRNNREVAVTRDQSGLLQITIGTPRTEILQTRIRSLTLKPYDRYNPMMAIDAILNTDEFNVAMRKFGLGLPLTVTDMNILEPEQGLPHLPVLLKELTVVQAFDLIARTFGGIVSYGTCSGTGNEHLIYVNFFEVGASNSAKQ